LDLPDLEKASERPRHPSFVNLEFFILSKLAYFVSLSFALWHQYE
jgi:hypothetical protein